MIHDTLKRLWPGASAEALDEVLWNGTPFPASSEEHIVSRLEELHAKYGENIRDVIIGIDQELDEEYRRYKAAQGKS